MDSETQWGHPILNNCELLKSVMWEIVDNNLRVYKDDDKDWKIDLYEFIKNQETRVSLFWTLNIWAEIQFSLKLIPCPPPPPPLFTSFSAAAFALLGAIWHRPALTNKSEFLHLTISAMWSNSAPLVAECHCFWVERRRFSAATNAVRIKWSCHGFVAVVISLF